MSTPYRCQHEQRRDAVATAKVGTQYRLNGIDYLEVEPGNQTKLALHFINKLADVTGYAPLSKDSFRISGGVRILNIRVVNPVVAQSDTLILTVDQPGDFSTYTLSLVESLSSDAPPAWIDPMLASVEFSFKINCPSDFDCKPQDNEAPDRIPEPVVDYLARDYASFRRLLLDRLGFLLPDWKERNPADLGVVLAELLAYVGDHLSYKQDAVATEAYLGTAHRRISLARHARLLDYPVGEGSNARAFVQVQVKKSGDGLILPGPDEETGLPGAAFLTRIDPQAAFFSLTDAKLQTALENGSRLFEALHSLTLYEAHNEMNFYDWGNEGCRLPQGSTQAFLQDNVNGQRLLLRKGDVIILEEKRSPQTGLVADADPARRHAVRLTYVSPEADLDEAGSRAPGTLMTDPLFPEQALVEIRWHEEDALPFDLCIHPVADPDEPGQDLPVCIASGNVLLADHGQTVFENIAVSGEKRFRPELSFSPLTRTSHVRIAGKNELVLFDAEGSAVQAVDGSAGTILPAIRLVQTAAASLVWSPVRDLLASNAYSREFVVETEESGRARLRFGDGLLGQKPDENLTFKVQYRIGNGTAGNVGAEALAHVLLRPDLGVAPGFNPSHIQKVRNPLSASGGTDAQSLEQIRKYAPQAFKTQERAVAAPDYAAMAMRHPGIQQAAATVRWTGSWHTVYVTLDRKGGKTVDDAFIAEMKAYLDCYRMAGYDIEVNGPQYVPLEMACDVCVKPGYFKMDVKKALLDAFSSRNLAFGRRGFFHPDRFTFGQAVYLSRIYETAMQIEGVAAIDVKKFKRLGKNAAGELAKGKLTVGRLEIARLDNDPNFPENGKIEFTMRDADV